MLTLSETVDLSPVHVFYMGTETEFLDELDRLEHAVPDPEHLEFTCCNSAHDLITHLYRYADVARDAARHEAVVVFGLLRHLERSGASAGTVLRHWSAVLNTGVSGLQFGDTAASELVDRILRATSAEGGRLNK